jgi:general secretion pathway protein D
MLMLNFRGASLEQVLSYLSEAAGYIINIRPGTSVRGKVDVWSSEPVTRDDALNLLDTVLNQNGLAAIRNGRMLSIVNRDEAKTQNIPVIQGADPKTIPLTDKIVTQIIPVRFVEASQLLKDLQPLVSMNVTMTANEAGNAIVITDTQANIHKVAEIVHNIDSSAEDVTVVKVFHLRHADPTETADLLTNLFPDDSRSGSSQAPVTFGGLGGGFRRFFGGGGGGGGGPFGGGLGGGGNQANANSQNQRIKKRNRVVAVADQRTGSVIVTATRDLVEQIADVVNELDEDPANLKTVAVFPLQNAEPQDAMQVLSDIFQKNTTQNNRNTLNQNNPLNTRTTQQNQQNSGNRTGIGNGGGGRGIGGGGGGGF